MNASLPSVFVSRIPPEEVALAPRFEQLVTELQSRGVAFTLIDSIYDQQEEDPGIKALQAVKGDLVFVGWHYPRALKWILARQHLEVNGLTRKLHCLDAREPAKLPELAAKVGDIVAGKASGEVSPLPNARGIGRKGKGAHPLSGQTGMSAPPENPEPPPFANVELAPPENAALSQRWYPVIDYDQCTNCMECMDFCLFGVYGVDHDSILRTVQQDQCRADCPACARVCPVGAIIFPKYKTNQTIAGSMDAKEERGEVKLDLSKIFGKPRALHQAALERDRELIKAGRLPPSAKKIEKLADAIDKLEV
ncbi:MAG TPA: ferredoxin family protein [Planctomycetota bacterium]|nr:ferredoxin family protein [Planctomycetota bacterium]